MKERNILAGFKTEEAAVQAGDKLRQAGFDIVQIDRIGQFPGDGVKNILNPITGEIPSLAKMTTAGDFPSGRDASILAAANPDASGMADRGDDNLEASILLTAVVPEERGDEATDIIRACGGMV